MIKNPIVDWISVEDDLPHQNERVLVVCYNFNDHRQTHVSMCTYFGKVNGHPRWSGNKCVTHWYPLPELPKDIQQTLRFK